MAAESGFDPEPILQSLNAHGVAYVVVGGFAVAAHGVIRATADLDVVVEGGWENARRLATALEELEARDESADRAPPTPEVLVRRADRRFATRHGEVHVLHEVPGVPDYRDFDVVSIALGTEEIPVASLADVRRMKRAAGRPKDAFDLAELDELHGPDKS